MNELHRKIGKLAADVVKLAMESGLVWDEAVAAFGIASKALAIRASTEGDGTQEECHEHASKRLAEGMKQNVDVLLSSRH